MDNLIQQGIKVDAIITDLPYGETRTKWDKIIPFKEMWERCEKMIKNNGAMVFFGNEPFSSQLRCSNLNLYRYDWKWIKNHQTGFGNANYRPMRKHEDIIVFSQANASAGGKANPMKYNPQGLIEINKTKKNRSNRHGLIMYANNNVGKDNRLMQDGTEYVQKYTNYPANILQFDVESYRFHPTQKPVALMEYLIKTYSNESDTILDFTMGSGSTGVACRNLNRHFIGIESDEKYFKIAENRIKGSLL
jgi:site-specific DNA-methyltransferase (adenine-specific)